MNSTNAKALVIVAKTQKVANLRDRKPRGTQATDWMGRMRSSARCLCERVSDLRLNELVCEHRSPRHEQNSLALSTGDSTGPDENLLSWILGAGCRLLAGLKFVRHGNDRIG